MIQAVINLLFRCHHKRLTMPITLLSKDKQSQPTYIACLDCGKHFSYDVITMRMGREIIPRAASAGDPAFQQTSA